MTQPGLARLNFYRRLSDSWRDLATVLEIPPRDVDAFRRGNEAREIWEWLSARERLMKLPDAVILISRSDLSELLEEALQVAEADRTSRGTIADPPDNVFVLYPNDPRQEASGTQPIDLTLYEVAVYKSEDLLVASRKLVASLTPSEALSQVPRLRRLCAEFAKELEKIAKLHSSDYERNNALGAARRHLRQLGAALPKNRSRADSLIGNDPNSSALLCAAKGLSDATALLRELAR
jgi:bDLD-like protein